MIDNKQVTIKTDQRQTQGRDWHPLVWERSICWTLAVAPRLQKMFMKIKTYGYMKCASETAGMGLHDNYVLA